MLFNNSLNEARRKYLAEIAAKPALSSAGNQELLKAFLAYFQSSRAYNQEVVKKRNELFNKLWPAGNKSIAGLFPALSRK